MTWLKGAWAWLRARAWFAAVIVIGALVALWRLATGQRDRARRERDAEAARADAAAKSAERERVVADASEAARATHKTAGALIEAKRARDLAPVEAAAKKVEAGTVTDLVAEANRRRRLR